LVDANAEWDRDLWRAIADMGVLGAAIPEQHGGQGLNVMDLCVIAEEMGRTTAAVPFFSSICLAAEAIRMAGSDSQKAHWLPKLATGEAIGTLAWNEGPGAASERRVSTTLDEGRLRGVKWPVPDAGVAHLCVVVARERGAPVLALTVLDPAHVVRDRLVGFDQVRPHFRLAFSDTPAERMGDENCSGLLERLLDQAATCVAFEQVGGAEACLHMARNYTMERKTFGRLLASYQAVKHNLANIYVSIELARSNAYFAAWALEQSVSEAPMAAANARLSATAAYELAARENLQLHGGMGFTWAGNCNFHYRRARLLALALGGEEVWSERLIRLLANEEEGRYGL
jgi:alkylation response protein AidB-like acyl-CoA dehydrogenase